MTIRTSVLAAVTLVTSAAVAVLAGAATLSLWSPASPVAGAGIAGVVALALAAALPLTVAFRVLGAMGDRKLHRPTLTFTTWLIVNALVLVIALVALRAPTGRALAAHGDWFLAGRTVPPVTSAAQWLGGQLAAAPAPDTTELPAAVPPDADVDAPADADLVAPAEAPADPIPDGPWTAKQVFAARAGSVAVVHVWSDSDRAWFGAREVESQGSAFAVEPDVLVTNHHVIDGAKRGAVALPDGRSLPMEILADDPTNDLALIRVAGAGLAPIPFADGAVAIGDACYAIGAPFGMDQTLTEGIVSANREVDGTQMLQMQTPIAPGSSGSPLLDAQGRVIGVNTATRGTGLNLAVDRVHVQALVAGPRAPRVVDPAADGLTLATLAIDGDSPPLPTTRSAVGQFATFVAQTLQPCVAAAEVVTPTAPPGGPTPNAPEDAALTPVTALASGVGAEIALVVDGGLAVHQTNLPPDGDRCVRDKIGELRVLGMQLRAMLPEGVKIRATFARQPAGAGSSVPGAAPLLTLTIRVPTG